MFVVMFPSKLIQLNGSYGLMMINMGNMGLIWIHTNGEERKQNNEKTLSFHPRNPSDFL